MAVQLPPLADVQRLSPHVIRILGGNPGEFTLQGTNTYLIGSGRSRILIDTGQGFPAWRSRLSSLLASEKATISTALLTHWHHDHTSGVEDLRSLCPDVKVHKSTAAQGPQDGNILDQQTFNTEGATLTALFCPGHTADHMAFLLDEEDKLAIFTGDNVLGHGTAVFEDLVIYMTSLVRMRDQISTLGGLTKVRAFPGHGEVIDDASGKIQEYISHREQREQEVLNELVRRASVSDGADTNGTTSMDIVKQVYRHYPEQLHAPARGGVLQVLRKLSKEGKIREMTIDHWVSNDANVKLCSKSAL